MSKLQSPRRTIGTLVCALLVGALPAQVAAFAEPPAGQAASRAARAKSAIEAIEQIAQRVPQQPGTLKQVENDSWEAVRTIGEAGSAALPGIETALTDPAKDARFKAMLCKALGQMKDEQAHAVLGRILDDRSQPKMVLAYAADALKWKRTPTAVAVIKHAVMDTRLPVDVRSAIMVDVGAGGIDDVDWLAKIAQGEGIGLPADPKAEISQNEYTMMLIAQRALARLKDPRAVDVMISLVERYPSNGILVEGLGKSGDRRAIPVLLKVLADASNHRHDAARALGELQAREAVEPLMEILENGHPASLVAASAAALGKIGDKRALPALEKLVANLKNDSRFLDSEWRLLEEGHGYIAQIMRAVEVLR